MEKKIFFFFKLKIHNKTPVPESFFFIKFLKLVLSFEFYEIFKSIYFEKHLWVVASEVSVSFIFNSLNAKVCLASNIQNSWRQLPAKDSIDSKKLPSF